MSAKNYIMVTGASSGVGKACIQLLSKKGYHLIAIIRTEDDYSKLESENVYPVKMDLNDQQSIENAKFTVSKITENRGLTGLVNCAGTIFSGPIEYFPRTDWQTQYDVNLIGTMALTSAMLPQIRKQNGRIVNIGAVGGGIALPFFGAIASAKIAFEAANDCLRRELHPWGIHVIIIEPGGINTPANDKMRDSVASYLKDAQPLVRERYGKAMEHFTRWAYEKHVNGLQPDQVAETVFKALKTKYPKTRYRRGWDSWGVVLAKWILPDRILDRILLRVAALPMKFGAFKTEIGDRDLNQ